MNLNQKQIDALLNILGYEQTHIPKDFDLGLSWSDVRVAPATLNNLLLKGLIEEKFHSNSYRGLLLTELGKPNIMLSIKRGFPPFIYLAPDLWSAPIFPEV